MDIRTNQTKNQIQSETTPHRAKNWPLIVGLLLVLIITILAIIGPNIAPKDPAEEHNITMIDGTWYVPPFDIGTPGYPLGSDAFGRDLFSRLLWGLRPTMIMVVVVATVRLILGVIIGLTAGWFTGKTGRFLNGLIQLALALPVLLVALGAIAIVGVELGIWAFIIGLSLTGWVDTALQVREQTRIIKGQVYVEAASAIGASNQQILSNHILKQIAPMLLMLFAFEISSTLMLSAGLGFLGYYIGGDVWVETDDFVARRISGSPELGQMLATSWVTLTKPWAMVVVGTTVFLTVLGFNLIGEGLRQNMGFSKVQRKSIFSEAQNRFALWLDNYLLHPVIQFFRIKPLRYGLTAIGIFFLLTLGALFMLDSANQSDISKVLAGFDQNDLAAADDSQSNTQEQSTVIPAGDAQIVSISYDPNLSWEIYDQGGFSGGPAFSTDQTQLYIASQSGNVYALDIDGVILWQVELQSGGVGTPAVDISGNFYVSDRDGGLYKITPQGEIIWRFQTEAGDRSQSGPAIGPDGNIFYTVGTPAKGFVQSVSPSGEGLWATQAKTNLFFETPIPSNDGKYVFLKNDIFSPENGDLVELEYDLEVNRYFSGQNEKNYLVAGQKIIQWEQVENAIEMIDIYEWDSSSFSGIGSPGYVGVNEDGISWQLYTTPGGNTRTVWVSNEDQSLGISEIKISAGTLVDMQSDLSAIVCGGDPFNNSSTDCALTTPGSEEPLWKFHLGNFGPVVGGAILDGRYFVSTEDGYLFEINENRQEVTASKEPELSSPAEIGLQWTYDTNITRGSILDFKKDTQGNIYITTGDDNVHILKPDGELVKILELPGSSFQSSNTGRNAPLFIFPEVLPDGTLIFISEDSIAYGIDPDGEILWEQTLQVDPAEPALHDDKGNLYLIDAEGGVNSFDRNGLKWRFQSEAANIPAHGLALGPEGNIYYVVTNYSKGFIQAVSHDGEPLWVVQATTRDFYDDLHISNDGKYISLAGNLVSTDTGEMIEYQSAGNVDEFIFSDNGQNFLRSLHTVSEWRIGPSGFEVLSNGIVSEEDTTLRPPLASSADSNGIVWLYYPEKYTGGGIIIVWMAPDGELLGNHLYDRNFYTIVSADMERSILTECRWFEESRSLDCNAYTPTSDDPIWSVNLKDILSYDGGFIDGNHLYLFGEENELFVVFLGEPTMP
ncbi:MAG: PQQ-binding-like beta-propeller repeat protein [Anaerolineales bacterium]